MKHIIYFFICLLSGTSYSQGIRFSMSIDNSMPVTSVVTLYAQSTANPGNTMAGVNIGVYYNGGEASITTPTNVDFTPAATNLNWVITINSTSSNTPIVNPSVPITHTHVVEVAPVNDGPQGLDVPMTPTAFCKLTFTKDPGDDITGGEIYLGAADNQSSFQYTDATNFDPWDVITVGDRTQLLPIQLVNFEARQFNVKSSKIIWSTSSEVNSSHFNIQRSFDNNSWANVGKVISNGNSQIIQNYQFVDENVYNGTDSRLTAYYRLQSVDLDDHSNISPVKSVVFTGTGTTLGREIVVYPNPASNGVHVEWEVEEFNQPTALEFYDINGKLILTQQVGEKSTQEYVDFTKTTILPGLYLLRVMKGAEPIDYKQIVVGQR